MPIPMSGMGAAFAAAHAASTQTVAIQAMLRDLRALLSAADAAIHPPKRPVVMEGKRRGAPAFDDTDAHHKMMELLASEPALSIPKAAARVAAEILAGRNDTGGTATRLARGYRDLLDSLRTDWPARQSAFRQRQAAQHTDMMRAAPYDYPAAHALAVSAGRLEGIAAECLALAPAMLAVARRLEADTLANLPPEPPPAPAPRTRRTKRSGGGAHG